MMVSKNVEYESSKNRILGESCSNICQISLSYSYICNSLVSVGKVTMRGDYQNHMPEVL